MGSTHVISTIIKKPREPWKVRRRQLIWPWVKTEEGSVKFICSVC